MKKFLSIIGARPQFVKVAPLCREFNGAPLRDQVEHQIVHTGQHYDQAMSDVFFDELEIPRPAVNLGIGSGLHGHQTGRMLEALEATLLELRPDLVIVYGDTNSTLAGALAAVKLQVPVCHLEAGLRSFNRAMPEEINRVVVDHTADQLLAPTLTAMRHLNAEGLTHRAVHTGDIMHDTTLFNRALAEQRSDVLERFDLTPGEYGVVTVHRAENTDGDAFRRLLHAFDDVARERLPLLFPVHPRAARRLQTDLADWQAHERFRLVDPLGYLDMLWLVDNARLVLTDSGGLQKEAFFLGCPCVTLREETEWAETVSGGGNLIAGTRPDAIREAADRWLNAPLPDLGAAAREHFGPGNAAELSAAALLRFATTGQVCVEN